MRVRWLAHLCGIAIVASIPWRAVAAQEYGGKLQGHIRSSAGEALPAAQVVIVGSAFGAVADRTGYYFINNIPTGTYTVRGQLIGYAAAEVQGVRILGGQTLDLDMTLQPAAVTIGTVTVTAAENPLVPRDQVTTKAIVAGTLVTDLPVSDTRQIVALQPGVVESGSLQGLSLRGSRPGEAQIYIDGAPVAALSFYTSLGSAPVLTLDVATNAVEEVTVTTGALGVSQGNAQSGAIGYTTRSGGERYTGAFAYETDEPLGNSLSQGLNRFEGSFGGPIPGVSRLRFFASAMVQGMRSAGVPSGPRGARAIMGAGWDRVPTWVVGGVDTVVNQTETDSAGSAVRQVVVPQFVQFTGQCPGGSDPANPVRDAILKNYGFDCQGGRLPMDWRTDARVQGKLLYSYGLGSSVSLTGLANGIQERRWPRGAILAPSMLTGQHNWSRAAILNLSHQVFRRSESELAVNLNASWQQENMIQGTLDAGYEVSSRDPALGIELGAVRFLDMNGIPFPVTEQIVRNLRTGTGLRAPYNGRGDLRPIQEYRLNPMGMAAGGWFTAGVDAVGATTKRETRYTGRLEADWQIDRFNRLNLGGEGLWSTFAEWAGPLTIATDVWASIAKPTVYGLYAADRLDLGDLVVEVGVRWDYFHTHALFPRVPGVPYYRWPDWPDEAVTNDDSLAAGLARAAYPGRAHTALSPRVRVSFPVSDRTDFRLSYGKQVQTPNIDYTLENNDVTFGQTIITEFGVRQGLSRDIVVDVSFYNKAISSALSFRTVQYDDPTNPGNTLFAGVATNLDFGYVRGIDAKLDLRLGAEFVGSLGYGLQTSRSTGSNPFAAAPQTIAQVTGDTVTPAQALSVTDFDRPHNLTATLAWTVRPGSAVASAAGGVFRDVGVYATGTYVSGLPYTPVNDRGDPTGGVNTARLPALRNVDLRVTKGFALGRLGATAYVDARNLFNIRNTTSVWWQTGTVNNQVLQDNNIESELSRLKADASGEGMLLPEDAVDLRNCARWTGQVNCVALNRAEARFGDGDGVYTVAEQQRALNTWWLMTAGPQYFYGPPRRVRIGVELTF